MIEEIVEWHKKTFPDADLKSQKIKFLEEYKEYLESGDIMELADMFIVETVLNWRFDYKDFYLLVCKEKFNKKFYEVEDAVNKKMEINKKRTWHKVNGVYRHV